MGLDSITDLLESPNPSNPEVGIIEKHLQNLQSDTPRERLLELAILGAKYSDLVNSINPHAEIFTLKNPELLEIAHHKAVTVAAKLLEEIARKAVIEAGGNLESFKDYLPTVVIPLHGAWRLAIDIIDKLSRANLDGRFNLVAVLEKFVFTFKDPQTQVVKYLNIHGQEIPEEQLKDQVAEDKTPAFFIDEMVDEGNQLKRFLENFQPNLPPLVISPTAKEPTDRILFEIYNSHFNWLLEQRQKANPKITEIGRHWYFGCILPSFAGSELWWMAAGSWNSSKVDGSDSVYERYCTIPLAILPDKFLAHMHTQGSYFADETEYINWLKKHQHQGATAILAANASEATDLESVQDLIAIVFNRYLNFAKNIGEG